MTPNLSDYQLLFRVYQYQSVPVPECTFNNTTEAEGAVRLLGNWPSKNSGGIQGIWRNGDDAVLFSEYKTWLCKVQCCSLYSRQWMRQQWHSHPIVQSESANTRKTGCLFRLNLLNQCLTFLWPAHLYSKVNKNIFMFHQTRADTLRHFLIPKSDFIFSLKGIVYHTSTTVLTHIG